MQNLFSPHVAQNILSVPLIPNVEVDTLMQTDERRGIYSVQLGYNFMMRNLKGVDKVYVEGDWGSIWRAEVPPKVRNLIWRICWGCLPTCVKLAKRMYLAL